MKIIDKYIFLFNFLKLRHLIYLWILTLFFLASSNEPLAIIGKNTISHKEGEITGIMRGYEKGRNTSRINIGVNGVMNSIPYGSQYLKDPMGKNIKKYKGKEIKINYILFDGYFSDRLIIYKISSENNNLFYNDKNTLINDFYNKTRKNIHVVGIFAALLFFSIVASLIFLVKKTKRSFS